MKRIISLLSLILIFLLVSCTNTKVNTTTNIKDDTTLVNTTKLIEEYNLVYGEYNLISNLKYRDDQKETSLYDLYLPSTISSGDINVVLFIHGGAWITGSKDDYKTFSTDGLAKYAVGTLKNTCVISMNYRLINESNPSITIYKMIEDITLLISKAKEELIDRGYNPKCLTLGGHSAGGHLALLYAYRYKLESAIPIKFVFSLSGPTDIDMEVYLPIGEKMLGSGFDKNYVYELGMLGTGTTNIKDAIEALKLVSPINYVDENTVPTLIFHGNSDEIVPYKNSTDLIAKLEEYSVYNKLVTVSKGNHNSSAETVKMRNYGFFKEFYYFYNMFM